MKAVLSGSEGQSLNIFWMLGMLVVGLRAFAGLFGLYTL